MKRIFMLLTTLFLLPVVAPSFAADYYQGSSDYEKAKREVEEYNANVSREYEKQMREYERKLRAHRSLLRRVEQQYPEIRARASASETSKDLQNSSTQEATGPQTVPTVRSLRRTNSAVSPRMKSFRSQSVRGQNSSQNTNLSNPSINPQDQNNVRSSP